LKKNTIICFLIGQNFNSLVVLFGSQRYYKSELDKLSLGPELFLVVSGLNFSDPLHQNLLCKSVDKGCASDSVSNIIRSLNSEEWQTSDMIPESWIDDYFEFLDPSNPCCRVHDRTAIPPVLCSADGECALDSMHHFQIKSLYCIFI
jgi:hypothetical protein